MTKKNKITFDPAIEKYYSTGNEKDRLNDHQLERDRTLMILKKMLPPSPAVILDIGGGAGVYAFPLASRGYHVHLIDPIPLHIKQAQEYERSSSAKLSSCSVGDARHVDKSDHFADAVLLFGPLYHLTCQKDRLRALEEAHRVLKPGGILLAVGISRFASLMDSLYKGVFYAKFNVIERELVTGIHHKITQGFDWGYLHKPDELKNEVEKSGFKNVSLFAIEGPVWHKDLMANLCQNQDGWKQLLLTLEKIEQEDTIIGASAHMMAIGRKNDQ